MSITWRHANFEAYWEFLLEVAGAISTLVESLDENQKSIAREAIERGVADFRSGEQIVLPSVTLNAAAC